MLFLAAEKYFENVGYVVRDFAHAVRIATQKPLRLESGFQKVLDELLDKKHSLIPDIQNSGKWKAILQSIQKEILRIPGMRLPGCLKIVLRHLSFARQRMDSSSDPLAKICCMLLPVALLLSLISCDERCLKDQRDRAIEMLKQFKPKFMLQAGVAADWGLVGTAFLRLFDKLDHDIACSEEEVIEFYQTITSCFIKGVFFSG